MNKKQFAVILFCTILFAFLGGMFSYSIFPGDSLIAQEQEPAKSGQGTGIQAYLLKQGFFIGLVKNGTFHLLAPKPSSPLAKTIRLTGIPTKAAACRFTDVALMALPQTVCLKK